jgi:hypothetical protein
MIELDEIIDELIVKGGFVFWAPPSVVQENA